MKNKLYLIFLSFLILTPSIYASYAVSSPRTITLKAGTSKEFDFQIQAHTSDQDLNCSYSIGNTAPFEIIFEKQGFNVNKKSISVVKGMIIAPKKIKDKSYSYDFCVSCLPKTKTSGITTGLRFCGIPMNINIVSEKEPIYPTKLIVILALSIMLVIFVIITRKLTKKYR